jgi:hypothetical protein
MKLEDQVVSLDLAKKLKELGVKQENQFVWVEWDTGAPTIELADSSDWTDPDETAYSAFTVAELGEMLPDYIAREGCLMVEKSTAHWTVGYASYSDFGLRRDAPTEANARAKMLIYLIENNLLPAPVAAETTSQEA